MGSEERLEGEVWRGVDDDGDPIAITMIDGRPGAWWLDLTGKWERCTAADIFRAWALAERTRAEKAEGALAHIEAMKRNWGQP